MSRDSSSAGKPQGPVNKFMGSSFGGRKEAPPQPSTTGIKILNFNPLAADFIGAKRNANAIETLERDLALASSSTIGGNSSAANGSSTVFVDCSTAAKKAKKEEKTKAKAAKAKGKEKLTMSQFILSDDEE
jgi:hypothetical protein